MYRIGLQYFTLLKLSVWYGIERTIYLYSDAYKALIRSTMTYVSPAWKFAAQTHLLKLQRVQNRVLRTIGNFPKHTSIRDMHAAFQVQYVYDFITKSCRRQAEIFIITKMKMYAILDKAKPHTEK
jgi:hypothetical protein